MGIKGMINKLNKLKDLSSKKLPNSNNTNKNNNESCVDETGIINGHKYVFKFPHAVCTEYWIGDSCGTTVKLGCMGNTLIEDYNVASHNMPCGTKIYIPALKGVINSDGIFEVADTGGHCFDFDIFLSYKNINKIGKRPLEVYVLSWGDKKMTTSYTYITKYFKENNRLSMYHKAWVSYLELGGSLINFWKFNDEDKKLKELDWYDEI
jgi:3D (Asp-Asp-Asp) domain-containing protein